MHRYRDRRSNEARVVGGNLRAAHQLVQTECSGEDRDEAERNQPNRRQPLTCGIRLALSWAARTAQSGNAGRHFGHGPILTTAAARGIRTVVGRVVGMLVSSFERTVLHV